MRKPARKFGMVVNSVRSIEETSKEATKKLSKEEILSIVAITLGIGGLTTGIIGLQNKRKFGSPSTPLRPYRGFYNPEENVQTIRRGPTPPPMPVQQQRQIVPPPSLVRRSLLTEFEQAAQLNQELDIDIRPGFIRITRGNMTRFLSLRQLLDNHLTRNPNDMNSPNNRLFRQYPGLEQVFNDWLTSIYDQLMLNYVNENSNQELFDTYPGLDQIFNNLLNNNNM